MSGGPPLEIAVDEADTRRLVVQGEVDIATAPRLCEVVMRRFDVGSEVVVDLSQVTFMDSAGVRTLDTLAGRAREAGHRMTISPRLAEPVRQVLRVTGMLDALPFGE